MSRPASVQALLDGGVAIINACAAEVAASKGQRFSKRIQVSNCRKCDKPTLSDGRDSRPLGGPYASMNEAKVDMPRVRLLAEKADAFAFFDNFRSAEIQTVNQAPLFGAAA